MHCIFSVMRSREMVVEKGRFSTIRQGYPQICGQLSTDDLENIVPWGDMAVLCLPVFQKHQIQ